MLAKLVTLTRRLLQRRRLACELDDELESHVEMQSRSNADAGMSSAQARRVTPRQFGGIEQTMEAVRDVRTLWLDSLWRDVRFARRMLRRGPGFAAGALLSLNVSIGFSPALFTLVDALLLRPLPVERGSARGRVHVLGRRLSVLHIFLS
jgi:hypothetical protein